VYPFSKIGQVFAELQTIYWFVSLNY
jgi:hypothetical protein